MTDNAINTVFKIVNNKKNKNLEIVPNFKKMLKNQQKKIMSKINYYNIII